MADFVPPIVCDAAGNFTSMTATGSAQNSFDSEEEQEGTACLVCDKENTAGTAYSRKTLTTPIVAGNEWHVRLYNWFSKIYDFSLPESMANGTGVPVLRFHDSGSYESIQLLRLDNSNGPSGHRKWVVGIACPNWSQTAYDPGWSYGVWRVIDIYGKCHASTGWIQVWEGGILRVEMTGADTASANQFDSIEVGFASSGATDRLCFAYDHIQVNDDQSPLSPGHRARPLVNASLAGRFSRGGLVSGAQALREYEKIRRAA